MICTILCAGGHTELSSFKLIKKTFLDIQPITLYPKFLLHNPSFLKLEDMGALGSTADLAPEPCDLLMCVHRNPNHTNTD